MLKARLGREWGWSPNGVMVGVVTLNLHERRSDLSFSTEALLGIAWAFFTGIIRAIGAGHSSPESLSAARV
jgi:hypothetical protein